MTPSASTLSVTPTTNVLTWRRCEKLPWIKPTTTPIPMPHRSPTAALPATEDPRMPAYAPESIIASTEMLSVPARSATYSPIAANSSGTLSRIALDRIVVMS